MTHIVVDVSFLGYQALHTMGDLAVEGESTGIIFNILTRILSVGTMYQTNKFVFAYDTPSGSGIRRAALPQYKDNRGGDQGEDEKEQRQSLYRQLDLLREEVLPALGFTNIFKSQGFEADDIIAAVVGVDLGGRYRGSGCRLPQGCEADDKFVIVSGDHDLYQLLGVAGRVVMYHPSTRVEYCYANFCKEFNVLPDMWPMVKAIAGCPTDNVPGVVGVGEITACKYVRGKLPEHLKTYANIIAAREQTGRNLPLVMLPHASFPTQEVIIKQPDFKGRSSSFASVCERYKFKTFQSEATLAQWRAFFSGSFAGEPKTPYGPPLGRVTLRKAPTLRATAPTQRDVTAVSFGF